MGKFLAQLAAVSLLTSYFYYHWAPEGYPCCLGKGPPWKQAGSDERIQVISRGETVRLEDHISPLGLTIVEFGADW